MPSHASLATDFDFPLASLSFVFLLKEDIIYIIYNFFHLFEKISASQETLGLLHVFIPSLISKSNLYLKMKTTVNKKSFRFMILNENSVSQSGYDSVKKLMSV